MRFWSLLTRAPSYSSWIVSPTWHVANCKQNNLPGYIGLVYHIKSLLISPETTSIRTVSGEMRRVLDVTGPCRGQRHGEQDSGKLTLKLRFSNWLPWCLRGLWDPKSLDVSHLVCPERQEGPELFAWETGSVRTAVHIERRKKDRRGSFFIYDYNWKRFEEL